MKPYLSILLIEESSEIVQWFLDVIHSIPGVNLCNIVVNSKAAVHMISISQFLPDIIFFGINISVRSVKVFIRIMKANISTEFIPVIMLDKVRNGEKSTGMKELKRIRRGATPFFGKEIEKFLESHLFQIQNTHILSKKNA